MTPLEEIQLKGIVSHVAAVLKKREGKQDVPFHPLYAESVDIALQVRVHAKSGAKPDKLIRQTYNETEEEFRFRMDQYQQITLKAWKKGKDFTSKYWNDQNYSIKWADDSDEAVEYMTTGYPLYRSITNYFSTVVHGNTIDDPNAFIAVEPKGIPVRINADGKEEVDDTKPVDPICRIYSSERVWSYSEIHLAVELPEKVALENNQQGFVFKIYNQNDIWIAKQTGRKSDFTFDVSLWYTHDLGYLPAWQLKGYPQEEDGRVLYESFFTDAIPDLNKAITKDSQLDAIDNKSAFPIRYYYEGARDGDCPNDADGYGKMWSLDGEQRVSINCEKCGGKGCRMRFSPMQDFVQREKGAFDTNADVAAPFPGVGYVSPSTETPKYLADRVESLLRQAMAAINIDIAEKPTGRTATEIVHIDLDEQHAFINLIAKTVFSTFEHCVTAVGTMRNKSFEPPVITPPTELMIRSSKQLTEEFADAKQASLPETTQNEIELEQAAQRWPGDIVLQNKIKFLQTSDGLYSNTATEISQMLSNGTTTQRDAVYHTYKESFLDEVLKEDEEFFNKDYEAQLQIMSVKIDSKIAEFPTTGQTADLTAGVSGA